MTSRNTTPAFVLSRDWANTYEADQRNFVWLQGEVQRAIYSAVAEATPLNVKLNLDNGDSR